MKSNLYRILLGLLCISAAIFIAAYDILRLKLGRDNSIPTPVAQLNEQEVTHAGVSIGRQTSAVKEIWPKTVAVKVGRGDTLAKILKEQGFTRTQVHEILLPLKRIYKSTQLRCGHIITLILDKPVDNSDVAFSLKQLLIRPEIGRELSVERLHNGHYAAKEHEVKLEREVRWIEGEIEGSLYDEANKKGIPSSTLQDMIRVYSFDVDFQRSLQPGDRYGLLFAVYVDPHTRQEKAGELIHASLTLTQKKYEIYRFQPDKRSAFEYFNHRGESVKKALLRTPVDGARLTSRFGARMHPILGYTKHHKGVDFGAPSGTPIMAAGDGIIEQIGRWGAYGNYIRIRHNRTYATAYAHLSRYAKGLKRGKRICQGQVIGYVGSTGRASGSHLHYEVLKNSVQINPLTLTFMPSGKLYGRQLELFNSMKLQLESFKKKYLAAETAKMSSPSVHKRS